MFSIITVNYNNASGLKRTIQSVINQTLSDIEYIVIDGASNDDSLAVIEKYNEDISYWVSESDNGIYHAMNKGIKVSKGQYLLFLNSGDILKSKYILESIQKKIKDNYDIYYGDLVFKSDLNTCIKKYPDELDFSFFLKESLPHPATFIKRTLFETLFYYSENFKIVSDWEFFIYAVCKENVKYKYLGEIISVFELDGISNDPANKKLITEEREQVLQKYFKAFIDNAYRIEKQNEILQQSSVQMVIDINNHKWPRRILSIFVEFLHAIFVKKL
ncbi:glycosyltransferase family 2 protein [uncultured Winogradskyella sp.]|uniref:glycosyltransferase family 2 protein n=1 Tax=uncultured Winogradskyella sp. TaxID=395353 RepID=UPI0030D98D34|tara:strand:+ start:11896 stop:12717 length:822 start_codon:yes stop_codon:yes gene_type:complete